ncbi:aminopeptidase [Arthrobacter sp. MSA 4-2]|uniref:aminopeptidase n=1 Tax=Arthrobacter sp. MSA 4-2 TaxID=2794349 RepID=UPI0018E87CCD|nr:aminopeptidase [Arthrobacter sp. MSA 4-2]MBJ2119460.1 aminopeptidase [Arthrobacter sp. MSA 4-2]
MAAEMRWKLLAAQLAKGTGVQRGSKVAVFVTDASAAPAVEAFVEECYRHGAQPQVLATDEKFDRLAVDFASDEVLEEPAPLEVASMEWADVHVSFRAMLPPLDSEVDSRRLAAQRRAKGVVSTLRWEQTRWALVRIPTPEWASAIGVPFETLLAEFFDGCLSDWNELRPRWETLCGMLEKEDSVQIRTPDSHLSLSTRGRLWVTFAGEANLPDGEIATAPVDDGVDGHIRFPGTFWFAGTAVTDLELEFERGLVVTASARRGQDFVSALLNTDSGSRRVGELGIGTNAGVSTATGDLLIDEKILGTVHIALGRAYPSCGGINQSSLHWDIVKDLRSPGSYLSAGNMQLIADGVVVNPLMIAR